MEQFHNFLSENSLYIVLIIVLIVWAGVFLYLFNTDKKLKKMEKELEKQDLNEKR